MLLTAILLALGAAAGVVLATAYVNYVNEDEIKRVARETIKNSTENVIKKAMKVKIKTKDYTGVSLEYLDKDLNTLATQEIKGNQVSSYINQGEYVYI